MGFHEHGTGPRTAIANMVSSRRGCVARKVVVGFWQEAEPQEKSAHGRDTAAAWQHDWQGASSPASATTCT